MSQSIFFFDSQSSTIWTTIVRFITKLLTYCLSLTLLLAVSLQASAIKKPNFLFIWIDDLRAELGCYGAEHIISPHIDRLADEGVIFDQAFCQEAICTVSRASLITGNVLIRMGFNGCPIIFAKKIRTLLPLWITWAIMAMRRSVWANNCIMNPKMSGMPGLM